MPVGRLKKIEIADRRHKVASLLLRRIPQWRIAEQLDLTHCTVSRDVKVLLQQWLDESVADIKVLKGRELAELDELECDCAIQFGAKEKKKKDVEWVHARLRIKQRRAKMMGLDDPELIGVVGPRGGPVKVEVSGAALARDVLNDPIAREAARTLTDRIGQSFTDEDDQDPHVSGNGQPG